MLPELQRRNKVGGLVDRRIGEGDAGMTAEERSIQRFAAEKGKKSGKSLFDLEGSDDEDGSFGAGFGLTHGGRALDDLPADDFGEDGEDNGRDEDELVRPKRRRSSDGIEEEGADSGSEDDQPERKKSKKEVMQEVIAKSKLHKYERQKAKEDNDDLREELDKGTDDMLALLRGYKPPTKPQPSSNVTTDGTEPYMNADRQKLLNGSSEPTMNPDRQRLLEGVDRDQVDREYDVRLKQLAQDAKAQPSERTKTDEEKIREEAERLEDLEGRRVRRMRGENLDEEEDAVDVGGEADSDDGVDEAADFGFTVSGISQNSKHDEQLVLEDEDEFVMDDNLVASGSDIDVSDEEDGSVSDDDESESYDQQQQLEDEEDEFVKGILGDAPAPEVPKINRTALAYTYPCPRSHTELLDTIKDTPVKQLPTIIQRIRALHHPSLGPNNKETTGDFAVVLVEHLSYMGLHKQPLRITEQVIRHLHSLSRTYPQRIAEAFRDQLQAAHDRKDLHAGDLIALTAIGSIYPTSDHWHQVVTPAMTLMARWLDVNAPDSVEKSKKGSLLVVLCVSYQRLSKRVVPEALRFTLRALDGKDAPKDEQRKAHVQNLMAMADLWKEKSAFIEKFTPALPLLKKSGAKREHQNLQIMLQQSRLRRRPLELHHHRPLPIRTSIPKFEENFDPDKHYDPDRERSDSKKLQKEYKRERKGALRELRKDANFIARQRLGEKRAADAEYEKKYRRLVAEVQGEAGRDENEYQRERRREERKIKGGKKR